MGKKKTPLSSSKLASTNLIPAKLLRGRKVCLAGRFSGWPKKDELLKFLRKEGAAIATKVSTDVDLLIMDGKQPATQKQAEKLNAGGASIEISEDLPSVLPLWDIAPRELLGAPGAMKRIADLPRYFFQERCFVLSGDELGKVTIAGAKGKEIWQFMFAKCGFRKTRFEDLNFRSPSFGSQVFENCTFDGSQLKNVMIDRISDCSFIKVQGLDVQLFVVNKCVIKNSQLTNTHWQCMSNAEITGSTIDGAGGATLTAFLAWSNVAETTFSNPKFCATTIRTSTFTKAKFIKGGFDGVRFEECKFTAVEFRDLEISELVFDQCELKGCTFVNCTGSHVDFGNSKVSGCKMQRSSIGVVQGNARQLKEIAGLTTESGATDVSKFPELRKLGELMLKSTRLAFSVKCSVAGGGTTSITVDRDWDVQFEQKPSRGKKGTFRIDSTMVSAASKDDIAQRLLRLLRDASASNIDAASLTMKTAKCPIKPPELKKLILGALFEAVGTEPQDQQQIAAATKSLRKDTAALRKAVLAELTAGDVKAFNKRTKAQRKQAHPFKKTALAGVNLGGLNAAELDLAGSDLSNADLSNSKLMSAVLRNVNLSGANLRKANLRGANLRGSDLLGADLSQADLRDASFSGVRTKGAVFDKANLSDMDLNGADFSSATLKGANLKGSCYNEKTKWPATIKTSDLKQMIWMGAGLPPHERTQNKKAVGPLDFDQFMARLNEITDRSRLSKATKMLKADAFQLFADVDDTSVAGVVKSQSDKKLIYSCMLNAEGDFACCTQNLNPCGGLRGALCKHLLVLIVGLAKSGDLDATLVDDWINSSKVKQPNLDKDAMSEILLKYKGAEAGEIDWRPTETIPEDYFAF